MCIYIFEYIYMVVGSDLSLYISACKYIYTYILIFVSWIMNDVCTYSKDFP